MQQPTSSISNFRLFLTRLLLPLFLIVAVVGLLFSYWFEQKVIYKANLCGAYKVHRIIAEQHDNEMPIFGSSRAEGGYIPDSLGADVYNYGLSGTLYNVTLFFLEEECKKKKKNPYILLNFDLSGVGKGIGDIANYIPESGTKEVRELLGAAYQPYFAIPFIRYYGRYDIYTRLYLNNKLELTKASNKGASLEKNSLAPEVFALRVKERLTYKGIFKHDTAVADQLFGIIGNHPERYFIFSIAPYHASFFTSYQSADIAQQFLAKLASFKNVRVLDFSKLPLADSMYLNTTHINYKGAKIFNHVLKDSLNSIFSTHRQ